jgi:GntR family transcriptional regulator, trigonelline degradation regulator
MADLRIAHAPNLREQVADKMRDAIVSGLFRPGMRLVERELCEQLGVSRSSIREALRQLEVEGLVTTPPNKGPAVTVIDAATARSIYQVRSVLESLAARLFVRNARSSHVASLTAAVERLALAYESGSLSEKLPAKTAFYQTLLDGAGNPVVTELLRNLNSRISQLRGRSLSSPNRLVESIAEIRALQAALIARDEDAAALACEAHITKAAEAAFQNLTDLTEKNSPKRAAG